MEHPIECPITAVPKEIREGIVVHSVPPEFHEELARIFTARKGINKRDHMKGGHKYYQDVSAIETALERVTAEMKDSVGLPRGSIIEYHSGWRYSVTSLENERRLHETAQKDEPIAKKEPGGLSHAYQNQPPERGHLRLCVVNQEDKST